MSIKEGKMANFLFVLSKDDNETTTRCFQFAKIAHEKEHKVNVFFIDSGVTWANKSRDLAIKTPTGDCPNDYLPYLVDNQVPIGVWIPCAKARQVDENKFFSNMVLAGGPHLIDLAAEAKVFNFWFTTTVFFIESKPPIPYRLETPVCRDMEFFTQKWVLDFPK